MSRDTFHWEDILETEKHMLETLQDDLMVPTVYTFLKNFWKVLRATKETVDLSEFLVDGTCLSYSLLRYPPSKVAAAVVFLAHGHTMREGWPQTLIEYSKYNEEDIVPVARAILEAHRTTTPLVSITMRGGWPQTLIEYSKYNEEDIVPVARAILEAHRTTPPGLIAIGKKHQMMLPHITLL